MMEMMVRRESGAASTLACRNKKINKMEVGGEKGDVIGTLDPAESRAV